MAHNFGSFEVYKAQTSLKSYLKLATEFSNRNVAHINMAWLP